MAKLFNKVRKKLVSEESSTQRTTNYLKYAVGEILLVVVGILIAMQINDWDNRNKLEEIERKYLTEIKGNLLTDLPDIEFNLEFNESRLRSNKIVLQYLNKEIGYTDSLKFHLGNLIFSTRTLPNMSAYENLKSKSLEIISNDSLRKSITTLYSFSYHNVIDFEKQDDHAFQYNLLLPEVAKALNIIAVWKHAEPISQQRILTNYQLKNVITMNIVLREYMLSFYHSLYTSIKDTIVQIDTELNK